jgi:hypothetical protein
MGSAGETELLLEAGHLRPLEDDLPVAGFLVGPKITDLSSAHR